MTADLQGVQPERLNLDWFSGAWSDNPIADFGIHPSELYAGDATSEEPIAGGADSVACAFAVSVENGFDRAEQSLLLPAVDLVRLKVFMDRDDIPERSVHGIVFGLCAVIGKKIR